MNVARNPRFSRVAVLKKNVDVATLVLSLGPLDKSQGLLVSLNDTDW